MRSLVAVCNKLAAPGSCAVQHGCCSFPYYAVRLVLALHCYIEQ